MQVKKKKKKNYDQTLVIRIFPVISTAVSVQQNQGTMLSPNHRLNDISTQILFTVLHIISYGTFRENLFKYQGH